MITRIYYYCLQVTFFAFLWSVLHEKLSAGIFFSGVVFGIISIIATEKFLLKKIVGSGKTQKFPFLRFFAFIFVLLFQIYKSGFVAIGKILTGKLDSSVVDIDTDIESEIIVSIMANAITLTPGTVTLEKKGKKLKVLWLDPKICDSDTAGYEIKGVYEKIFRRTGA